MSDFLKWIDEATASAAIADVRNDKTDTDWFDSIISLVIHYLTPIFRAIISYEGKTGPASQKLKFLASGSGVIEELSQQLTDDIIGYALLRETDVVCNTISTLCI